MRRTGLPFLHHRHNADRVRAAEVGRVIRLYPVYGLRKSIHFIFFFNERDIADVPERQNLSAESGGVFKTLLLGRRFHAALKFPYQLSFLALKQERNVPNGTSIITFCYFSCAHTRTQSHLPVKTLSTRFNLVNKVKPCNFTGDTRISIRENFSDEPQGFFQLSAVRKGSEPVGSF